MNHKRPLPSRLIQGLLLSAAIFLAGSSLQAEEPAAQPPEDLDIYLLIGQSNMAGRAPIPEEAKGPIDRCWLLNAEGKWEPASNPLNI